SAGAAKPAAAAAPAGGGKAAQAAAIFDKLKERLAKEPALAKEVGALVGFKITSPEASWTVDFAGGGGVKIGADPMAAATLTLSDDDLASLAKGAETAQRLYQTGKLRVDGDVRVAQRLGILKGLG